MKIGTQHRNKIWKSLVDFRNSSAFQGSQTQAMQRSSSNASTASMASQGSGYCPGYYEVTRYTFKHTISMKQEEGRDHDYCTNQQGALPQYEPGSSL